MIPKTNSKKIFLISLVLGLLILISVPIPPNFIDGMNGGFAFSAILLFLSIVCFSISYVYFMLYRNEKSIDPNDVIVKWNYNNTEWDSFVKEEKIRDKSEKKTLFFIISGWALFFAILFPIFDRENGIFVSLIMFGLIIIIAITAFLSIYFTTKNLNRNTISIITKNGVYFNGRYYTWNLPFSNLISVKFFRKAKIPYISFNFTGGRSQYNIRVPVPKDKIKEADKVLREFNYR